MRACSHYSFKVKDPEVKFETYIIQSEGYPWNAWKRIYDDTGKLCYESFELGLYWEYLRHLKRNKQCREEIGYTLDDVNKILREIEDEWIKITDP